MGEKADECRSQSLKQSISAYFEDADVAAASYQINRVRDISVNVVRSVPRLLPTYLLLTQVVGADESALISSQVTSFISIYGNEHQFSGRDVAKILYGRSPCVVSHWSHSVTRRCVQSDGVFVIL